MALRKNSMREQEFLLNYSKEAIIDMELKNSGQERNQEQSLSEIKRQIALDDLEEIKQGRHIMTPAEVERREKQIDQLAKFSGQEAEETIKKLYADIEVGTRRSTRNQEPKSKEEILEEIQENIKRRNTLRFEEKARDMEKSRTSLYRGR